MKLYISTGNSRMEKKWNGQEMEFSVFLERLSHTVRTSETMEQYRKMSKAKQDSIKDVGGFVLGKLKGGRRKKANVLFRSGLTLDMDYATEDIAEQIEMFFDFRCLIYSTHKHTPEKPRLRLIIPLSRPYRRMNMQQWQEKWQRISVWSCLMIQPTNQAASCIGLPPLQMENSFSVIFREHF